MKHPVIHLEEYHLEKILIERQESDQSSDHVSMAFAYDYYVHRSAKESHLYKLTFIVQDDPTAKTSYPQLYNIDLRIQGIFRFDEGLEQSQMQHLVRVNGGTILYGILRGMLATMTGSFPEGPINLPTIMMDEVVRRVEEKRAPKPASKKTAPKKTAKKPTGKASTPKRK